MNIAPDLRRSQPSMLRVFLHGPEKQRAFLDSVPHLLRECGGAGGKGGTGRCVQPELRRPLLTPSPISLKDPMTRGARATFLLRVGGRGVDDEVNP